MKRFVLLMTAFFLIASLTPAQAEEEEELAPGYNMCMEAAGGATAPMKDCLNYAYEYWDARLNANFRKAQNFCKETSNPEKCGKDLLSAQRHWIAYKETTSDLVALPSEGGSWASILSMDFLIQETRKQAKLLGGLTH